MPIPPLNDPTAEPQTLDAILDWNRGIAGALIDQRAAILLAIRTGSPIGPRFLGMTEAELNVHFDAQRQELDRLTVLNLVASAEASLRIDFFRRVKDRLKDLLSVVYREWFDELPAHKQLRPDFDEGGILHCLKQSRVMDNHIIGRFRECLPARHWIGHGRFWARPAAVDQFDPHDVHLRAHAVLTALPA